MNIATNQNPHIQGFVKSRRAAIDNHPSILTEIFEEDTNIAIWKRNLSTELTRCVKQLLATKSNLQTNIVVTPENVYSKLNEADNKLADASQLRESIAELTDIFCLLFGLKEVGLRLTTLDRAMCPRFHIDFIPSRLVCTYHGASTEWLPHDLINRSKLGRGNNGLIDEESGLLSNIQDINQLNTGDVAILKGERWVGNEHAGLVHRSPHVPEGENRLLLTLDFIS